MVSVFLVSGFVDPLNVFRTLRSSSEKQPESAGCMVHADSSFQLEFSTEFALLSAETREACC